MENKLFKSYIVFLYWFFRIGFWLYLAGMSLMLLVNYFTYNSNDGFRFTVRGAIYALDENWKPVKGEMLDSTASKSIFWLNGHRQGFMRIDFTDLSAVLTLDNIVWAVMELLSLLFWLFIIYQLMKIIQSLKNESVFDQKNITRIKVIGWLVIFIPIINGLRDHWFSIIVAQHLKIPGFILQSNFSIYNLLPDVSYFYDHNGFEKIISGLIILVIAQVFKYGMELQQEKDLTI